MKFLLVGLAVLGGVGGARADVAGSLSAAQLAQLKSGQQVVTQKDMPGGIWPEVTVYTLVKAPVATIEAMLRDYEHAPDFQPSLVSAKVVCQPNANMYVVEYTSKMPIFGTMSYTVQNTFSVSDGGVNVQWKLLESPMAEISDGSLRAEPNGAGSILRYTNYVKPKSSIAVVAKGAALGEVKSTVAALTAEAERRAK